MPAAASAPPTEGRPVQHAAKRNFGCASVPHKKQGVNLFSRGVRVVVVFQEVGGKTTLQLSPVAQDREDKGIKDEPPH